ncbi:MAG TPA: hypothetical protein PKI14_10795, partial [Fervidobacterium sp.]|nr:hypothetical protein [Fervidobacterium sp.]
LQVFPLKQLHVAAVAVGNKKALIKFFKNKENCPAKYPITVYYGYSNSTQPCDLKSSTLASNSSDVTSRYSAKQPKQ